LVVLDTSGQRYREITGLREGLRPGQTAEFTFRFDNGVTITTQVPIEVPMSPLPRSPLEMDEEGHA
jgi:hypothetical protein